MGYERFVSFNKIIRTGKTVVNRLGPSIIIPGEAIHQSLCNVLQISYVEWLFKKEEFQANCSKL